MNLYQSVKLIEQIDQQAQKESINDVLDRIQRRSNTVQLGDCQHKFKAFKPMFFCQLALLEAAILVFKAQLSPEDFKEYEEWVKEAVNGFGS